MRNATRLLSACRAPRRICLLPRYPLCPSAASRVATTAHRRFLSTASSNAPSSSPLTPKQLLSNPSAASALPYPVVLPTYDRTAINCGIVHLGLGAFPRAHLAYYMDALLHTGDESARAWGISGVGIRRDDRTVSEVLKGQDGLYTVVGRGGAASDVEVRVVGSVLEYIFAPDEPQRLLERLLSSDTKIVSLNVTEGGYESEKNPEIDEDSNNYHRLVQHLKPSTSNPPQSTSSAPSSQYWPRSAFGWIVLGLDGRRRLGLPAYSVMSMDNVQLNGLVTKRCLLHIARPVAELSAYIRDDVSCPSSMVDRITPVTTPEQAVYVKDVYGIDDRWPLLPEHWIQWVVEDEPARPFAAGRPPLELLASAASTTDDDANANRYNVLIVHDVAPYEHMKLRLLNASHSGICYLGYLCGYDYIHEVMADPLFVQHMRRFMDDEVTPTLPPVPNISLKRYKRTLIERFANANIRDTVTRVCQNGGNKWPKFLVPTLQAQLSGGGGGKAQLHHSALIVAAWLRYLDGVDERGKEIQIMDATAEQLGLLQLAAENRGSLGGGKDSKGEHVSAKRLMEAAGDVVFGSAWRDDGFVSEVQNALDSLYEVGARATMQRWLDQDDKKNAANV